MTIINKCYSYFFPESTEYKLQKSLGQNETQSVIDLIYDNPSVIHKPLSTGYYPIDLALAHKNIVLAQYMSFKGAALNQSMDLKSPSTMDHLVRQNDSKLLTKFLGPILETHLRVSFHEFNQFNKVELQIAKQEATVLLKDIQLQIETHQKTIQRLKESSELCKNASKMKKNDFLLFLYQRQMSLSNEDIFNALVTAISLHKNENAIALIEIFSTDLLMMQTTDFKDLYHIATIANNAPFIDQLTELGLAESPYKNADALGILSPFHYAIAQPTLDTFFALSRANLKYPSPKPLEAYKQQRLSLNPYNLKPNPTQLLILRSQITDPIGGDPYSQNLLTLKVLFDVATYLVKNYAPDHQSISGFLKVGSTLMTVSMLTQFVADIKDDYKNTSFKDVLSKGFRMLGSLAVLSVSNDLAIGYFKTLLKPLQVFSAALIANNIYQNFTKYQKTYLYRPKDTAYKLIQDSIKSAIYIKHTFYDLPKYVQTCHQFQKWLKNFKFSSFESAKGDHGSFFEEHFSPVSKCSNGFLPKTSNLKILVERIPLITEETFKCCFKKVKEDHSMFMSSSSKLIDCLVSGGVLPYKGKMKIYRELHRRIHPDKCNKPPHALSPEFCEDFQENNLQLFTEWFGK